MRASFFLRYIWFAQNNTVGLTSKLHSKKAFESNIGTCD